MIPSDPSRPRPSTARLLGCLGLLLIVPSPLSTDELRGYTAASAAVQREWEAKFRAIPSADSLRSYMRRLAARPHHVGSPHGRANAEWMVQRLRSWGFEAEIETFDVLFPTPRERAVELVAPRRFVASLREPAVPGDPTSAQQAEQLPTYNAFSGDGDVTAPLVFVNYGIPEDYERLERMGISVRGAIVIAKYGRSWRGIKPKLAAEHGAVGCLIYSDPSDDGYHAGTVYPEGPWRPSTGVQRGSVMDMPLHPGDPLTPGVGATGDARRLARADAATIMPIPVLPLSHADAQPLLAALGGPTAPREWAGGLPLTYRVGPGPARVRLRVQSEWRLQPAHNVIARLRGTDAPDEWIVRGNHHDAWVNGAQDPISGLVALLEEARALGQLAREGWRPRRTIVYAAWDAEEPGLIGSTEWAEAHADELRAKAVAYLNTDSNSRGFLGLGGSHSLERFINDVARDIPDPETGLSTWKRAQLRRIAQAGTGKARQEARTRRDLRIGALGSGSDYTPFLQHLGIASLNLGFGGHGGGGIYHSIYDDFSWYSRFDDTSFVYGRALAQTVGTAVLRLAGADVLPYEFAGLAETVRTYADELGELARERRETIVERNRQIEEGVFSATADPREPSVPPGREAVPPHPSLAPLLNGLDRLAASAERYETALAALQRGDGAGLARPEARAANPLLLRVERALTDSAGLPRRPWFRHLIYAPGFYTGYGVKTVPGVREAIEQGAWAEADAEAVRVGRALEGAAALVDSAASALEAATR